MVSIGPVRQMVFVMHHVAGVRLIPRDWLEGFLPSGFREATAGEIAFWHEERGLEPPVDGEVMQMPATAATGDARYGDGPAAS